MPLRTLSLGDPGESREPELELKRAAAHRELRLLRAAPEDLRLVLLGEPRLLGLLTRVLESSSARAAP